MVEGEENTEGGRELTPSSLEKSFEEYSLSERLGQAARGYIPPLIGYTGGFLASGNMIGAGIGMFATSVAVGTYRLAKRSKIPSVELGGYATGMTFGVFWAIYEAASRIFQ